MDEMLICRWYLVIMSILSSWHDLGLELPCLPQLTGEWRCPLQGRSCFAPASEEDLWEFLNNKKGIAYRKNLGLLIYHDNKKDDQGKK